MTAVTGAKEAQAISDADTISDAGGGELTWHEHDTTRHGSSYGC